MHTSNKIVACLFLCLAVIFQSSNLVAQTSNDESSNPRNRPGKGSLSLDFRITDEFTLTSFNGSMISCKYQYSDRSALRWGLTVNGYHRENEYDPDGRKITYDVYNIKIIAQYMHYPSPSRRLGFYYAFGPTVSYNHYRSKEDYYDALSRLNNKLWRNINAGFQANWGVEWFISRDISLVAEYGATLALYGQDAYDPYLGSSLPAKVEFRLYSNLVNFGVSVYF